MLYATLLLNNLCLHVARRTAVVTTSTYSIRVRIVYSYMYESVVADDAPCVAPLCGLRTTMSGKVELRCIESASSGKEVCATHLFYIKYPSTWIRSSSRGKYFVIVGING